MKRMTLLTALALVFSLFTVTAAIAGPGPGTGEGDQAGDTIRTQDRTQTQDGECEADDCQIGEMAQTQAQTQTRTQDGGCEADDCQSGEMTQTRTKTQAREQADECQAGDCPTEDALKAQNQMQERLMNRILEMLDAESAEVEGQYRLFLNLMLQNMLRFRALFI